MQSNLSYAAIIVKKDKLVNMECGVLGSRCRAGQTMYRTQCERSEEGSLVAAHCTGGESDAISESALGYQPPRTTWPPSFLQQMWQSSPTAKQPRPDVWPPLAPPAFRLKPGRAF